MSRGDAYGLTSKDENLDNNSTPFVINELLCYADFCREILSEEEIKETLRKFYSPIEIQEALELLRIKSNPKQSQDSSDSGFCSMISLSGDLDQLARLACTRPLSCFAAKNLSRLPPLPRNKSELVVKYNPHEENLNFRREDAAIKGNQRLTLISSATEDDVFTSSDSEGIYEDPRSLQSVQQSKKVTNPFPSSFFPNEDKASATNQPISEQSSLKEEEPAERKPSEVLDASPSERRGRAFKQIGKSKYLGWCFCFNTCRKFKLE